MSNETVHPNWSYPAFGEIVRRAKSRTVASTPDMPLVDYIIHQVKRSGMPMITIAYRAGIKHHTLQNIVYGRKKPRRDEAEAIAEVLGISQDAIRIMWLRDRNGK